MATGLSGPMLLKGGTLLTHTKDEPPKITPQFNHDILIRDGLIAEIGQGLQPSGADVHVVDCAGKIISPGFINTHVHLWQPALKGRHSDDTLFDYLPRGNWPDYLYEPEDIYIGQLAGCLESLDGGNTTVLDHSHGCYTTKHIDRAVGATIDSGIRAVWAYSEPTRLKKWDENVCEPSYDYWNEEITSYVEMLAQKLNETGGRVEIGLAFDLWFMPKEATRALFQRLTAAGIKTFTSHVGRDVIQGLSMPFTNMHSNHEILQKSQSFLGFQNFVASHSLNLPDEELKLLKNVREDGLNLSMSSTPTTEMPMCLHKTPAFHPDLIDPPHNSAVSLGVDCLSSGMSYLPAIGTMLLNSVRTQSNEKYYANDTYPLKMRGSNSEIFNMMTVYGARALGMDKQDGGIGRLEVGRKADIVVINTDRLAIGVAAQHNPIDALLCFSNAGDVEHVLVQGKPVKWDGRLLPVQTQGSGAIEVREVQSRLLESYKRIQPMWEKLSMEKAREMMVSLFYIDASKFVSGEK